MFCKYCGKEIKDGSIFCPYCGKKIQNSESQEENLTKNSTNNVSLDKKNLTKAELQPKEKKVTQHVKDSSHKSHKICFFSAFAFFVILITCFILTGKKEKSYYSERYELTNTQSQYEPGRNSIDTKPQIKNTAHYIGYLATVDDLVNLKNFIDSHCGETVNLEFYYPENLRLRYVDINSSLKVFDPRENMNTSVPNVLSYWGKNSFIYVASNLLYSEKSQYEHKYERYDGHLSFWLYGTNIKPNMFILNIKSNYGQITWETSSDIDEAIRDFNFKISQDNPNFEKIYLKGTFKIEPPVKIDDFYNHAGYPTYPGNWLDLDNNYEYFTHDGDPTDMVVYNLIPE